MGNLRRRQYQRAGGALFSATRLLSAGDAFEVIILGQRSLQCAPNNAMLHTTTTFISAKNVAALPMSFARFDN